MNTKAKVLVPNQVWIVEDQGTKLGTLNKEKKGYAFFRNGVKTQLHNLSEVKAQFGSELFKETVDNIDSVKATDSRHVHDYPCNSKPYSPVYNIKKRLPIYSKSSKSKSFYCAGYYIIQFKKGWVKSFCPKLITLERYPFHGPFKSECEMKIVLNQVNTL